MEGIYFYWLVWIAWIYVTFIVEKNNFRIQVAVFLLTAIIFSNYTITLFSTVINSTLPLFIIVGCYLISRKTKMMYIYYLVCSIILTCSYVIFRLFQLYDPVWVMFNPTIKLALILVLIILLLVKDQRSRVAVLLISITIGEIVYTLFINSLVSSLVIGQNETLDIFAITITATYLWYSFERLVQLIHNSVKQRTVYITHKR